MIADESRPLPRILVVLVAIGLLAAAALFYLDFRAMRSNTVGNSQVGTGSSGSPVIAQQPLALYVRGPAHVAAVARRELAERLGAGPAFREVAILPDPSPGTDGAVLAVEIVVDDSLWTPFYATASLTVEAAFASDGKIVWADLGTTDHSYTAEPAVRSEIDLTIADRSIGLISRPAYRRHLGEQVATRLTEIVESALPNS